MEYYAEGLETYEALDGKKENKNFTDIIPKWQLLLYGNTATELVVAKS